MQTRNKIIKEVVQCAEANGWHVDAEKHQDKNIVIFEFSQFTPAGQDFFFSATGKNGAPYRMKDVLADMEAAEDMVCKLLEAVKGLTS